MNTLFLGIVIFLIVLAVSDLVVGVSNDAAVLQSSLSDYRKRIIHDIQTRQLNIEAMTVFLSVVQESQELLSALRHLMRGEGKMGE